MRRLVSLILALLALALAACGSGGSSTKTGAYNPNPPGATSTFKTTSVPQRPIPSIPTVASACRGLAPLGATTADAARLKARLDHTIAALTAYISHRAHGRSARVEQLRAKSVLSAMRTASDAAGRYLAKPSVSSRTALIQAVGSEQNTAAAETLPACGVPKS